MEEPTRWELSDHDKFAPIMITKFFLFYETQPSTKLDELIAALQAGIQNAINQYPFMAGTVRVDPSSGKPYILISPGAEQHLELRIRNFAEDEYKSFAALADRSFHPDDVDPTKLVPEWPAHKPACILQLNVIQGGLILTWAGDHAVSDWVSSDAFISTVCQASKAYLHKLLMPVVPVPDLNRAPFNGQDLLADGGMTRQDLLDRCPHYNLIDLNASPVQVKESPADFQSLIYQIREPEVQQLKKQCSSSLLDGVGYVSSYDCIAAVLWTSITRVRLLCHPDKAGKQSRFVHFVNLRARDPEHATSPAYFGNAIMPTQAGPVDVQSLLTEADGGVSAAASLIRRSISQTSLSSPSVKNLQALIHAVAANERLRYRADFNDMDVLVNSWYSGKAENYDIGLGRPKAFRCCRRLTGAYCMLMPNLSENSTSRVYDVFVQLRRDEAQTLRRDAEFGRYFKLLTT